MKNLLSLQPPVFSYRTRRARLVLLVFSLSVFHLLSLSAHAQSAAASPRAQAHADAAALFAQGSDEAGAKALSDANLNPKNSAEWHLETANALLHAALEQHRAARPEKTDSIARRALRQANFAVQKAGTPALAAAAQETAAYITERLLGDYAGAKARYQDAARRYPQGDAAKEAERIDKIEQEADRKARQPRT